MEQTHTDRPVPALRWSQQRVMWVWPVLALLLLLAALAGFWLGRSRTPGEGSPEVTFARAMADHHMQAVEMALIIRERTTGEDLQGFALDIILTQQGQIGLMQGWLEAWGRPLTSFQAPIDEHNAMMGMATRQQVNELRTLPVPEAEVAFLQLMIRHHEGGVAMAQEVLDQTNHPAVVRLANAIVNGQQSEIEYMQALLAERGIEQTAPEEPAHAGDH